MAWQQRIVLPPVGRPKLSSDWVLTMRASSHTYEAMKTNTFFDSQAAAIQFAAENNGAVSRNDTESFLLPPEFWAQLGGSPAAFAVAIRAHAEKVWAGDIEPAWNDALDGNIRGVPASAMSALDAQFRTKVVSTRWMVDYDDGTVAVEAGSSSIDAGMPGNEDGAWGSSSSDGWRVD
jgi:hypothetical protein